MCWFLLLVCLFQVGTFVSRQTAKNDFELRPAQTGFIYWLVYTGFIDIYLHRKREYKLKWKIVRATLPCHCLCKLQSNMNKLSREADKLSQVKPVFFLCSACGEHECLIRFLHLTSADSASSIHKNTPYLEVKQESKPRNHASLNLLVQSNPSYTNTRCHYIMMSLPLPGSPSRNGKLIPMPDVFFLALRSKWEVLDV